MTIDLKRLLKLANISIDDPLKISSNLDDITTHFKILDSLDTKNTVPTFQVSGLKNISRLDEIKQNTPIHSGFFVTKSVINKNG